jgi:hypothetical protein
VLRQRLFKGHPLQREKNMSAVQAKRCSWVNVDDQLLLEYHDREWGVPTHDDRRHFEFLVLEAAQAGLSWSIVLKKREGYRRAFSQFDPEKVARYSPARIRPERIRATTKSVAFSSSDSRHDRRVGRI